MKHCRCLLLREIPGKERAKMQYVQHTGHYNSKYYCHELLSTQRKHGWWWQWCLFWIIRLTYMLHVRGVERRRTKQQRCGVVVLLFCFLFFFIRENAVNTMFVTNCTLACWCSIQLDKSCVKSSLRRVVVGYSDCTSKDQGTLEQILVNLEEKKIRFLKPMWCKREKQDKSL